MNIDILRIIALFDIVLIHTLKSQNNFDILNFMFTFVSIGINLFIMISGYLLLDKEEDIRVFYKKRFFSIIPLYVIWSIIYIIYYKENPLYVLAGYRYAAGHLWYIPMITGLYIITPWLRKVLKYCEKETGIVVLMWFIINILNPALIFFRLPFLNLSAFPITGFLGYYILGYYIKKYKDRLHINYYRIAYTAGFIFTFAVSWYFMKVVGKKNVFFYDKNSVSVFFMSVSFFVIIIKMNLGYIKGKAATTVKFLSAHSYFVYLAHLLFYETGMHITKNFYLVTLLCITVSYLTACIYAETEKIFRKTLWKQKRQ